MTRILDVVQGTPAWHAERARRFTASEAPAMMGASKFQSRADLLRQKATGIVPEVDAATQRRFDAGHAAEAGARSIVEEMLGTDLYPVTCVSDDDLLLASLDGQTLDESTIFEAKLWNEDLVAQVQRGELESHYFWQLEQELLVSGAERVIFVCSDGTRERFVGMEYRAVPGRAEQLLAGWAQFREDLAAYIPAEPVERVTAAPVEALPAVSVRMEGALAVHSNLDVFGAKLREFIQRIPAKPSTEQEFADCDAACKALKRAEEALDGAEANALGQVSSVEQVTRLIADLRNVARTARLASEKVVKARKEQIRGEEVQRGRDALAAHVAELNRQIGKPYMPPLVAPFGDAISGKKTVDSVRAAVDQTLANAKITANEIAGRIQLNMAALRELAADHTFLFADIAQLVLRDADACRALIAGRIAEHQAKVQRDAEAAAEKQRERIRAEEQAKAEKEAREKLAAEQAAQRAAVPVAPQPAAAPAIAPPAPVSQAVAPSPNVVQMQRSAPAGQPTLNLSKINQRIAPLAITADGLAKLGFPAAGKQGAVVLFHDSDFSRMVDSAIAHLRMAQQVSSQAAEAA